MKMLMQLAVGDKIRPKRLLTNSIIRRWKYAAECADVGGGLLPAAELAIVEKSIQPGHFWIRAAIPGSWPERLLKISGEEYAMQFESA